MLTYRRQRLNNTQRQELYDRCRGLADYPTCNICNLLVLPGQDWDESHDPDGPPHCMGGTDTGLAHSRCNREHGAKVVGPMVAKCDRAHQKFTGAYRSRQPMRGGRHDGVKRTMEGRVVARKTLSDKHKELGLYEAGGNSDDYEARLEAAAIAMEERR